MDFPYDVEMVSEDVSGGVKVTRSCQDLDSAEDEADALSDWMASKGIPGCARVVRDGGILYSVNAGRHHGVRLDDSPPA